MLQRLVEFIKNNYPEATLDEYLDAKYISLNSEQLKKIDNKYFIALLSKINRNP